jgi:hypothetical protein
MSYGKHAGEPYISNFTFAFLEDTGHYRMNYNGTGRLVKDLEVVGQCGEDLNSGYLDFVFGNDQSANVGWRRHVCTAWTCARLHECMHMVDTHARITCTSHSCMCSSIFMCLHTLQTHAWTPLCSGSASLWAAFPAVVLCWDHAGLQAAHQLPR